MTESTEMLYLWQYEHGSRWITYPENTLDVINKAYSKRQKTVTLPDKDAKKHIVVNFEKMYQKNKISDREQRVRCCIFNKRFYVWQWKSDDGVWNPYVPAVSFLLEVSFSMKKEEAKYFLKDDYKVNLVKMKEINEKTGDIYDVKREYIGTVEMTSSMRRITSAFSENLNAQSSENDLDVGDTRANEMRGKHRANEMLGKHRATQGLFNIPVDPDCPLVDEVFVFSEGTTEYDATLSRTDLQLNINKFYRLQLLKHAINGKFFVWLHSGRIGTKGQTQLIPFERNLERALLYFKRTFEEKTKNHWDAKDSFIKYTGRYVLLTMDYNLDVPEKRKRKLSMYLNFKICQFMELISNVNQVEEYVVAERYDIAKMPLGKLSKQEITAGYEASKKIEDIIDKKGLGSALLSANNEFYTKIPHKFGLKPPVINSKQMIREKVELLEALSNIDMEVLQNSGNSDYSEMYDSLKCKIEVMDSNEEMFKIIEKYCLMTSGPTHNNYELSVLDIFKCSKDQEKLKFKDYGNKHLLWHGSRMINFFSILKHGLLIAPPEVPSTGYMFGKGIYFADISTKSANYCHASESNNTGLLLLCEVSLGKENILYSADVNAKSATKMKNKNSVKAVGLYQIKETISKNGVIIPIGKPCSTGHWKKTDLMYNEYVVYNCDQVMLKYIVHVGFNFT